MSVDVVAAEAEPARVGLREVLLALRRPKIALALVMGVSTGAPFVLMGVTLGYWLREEGLTLQAIGFFAWIGLFFSLKFLWAPAVDRISPPVLGRLLGRTRAWMALGQIGCMAGLGAMALIGPEGGLGTFAGFALFAAFCAATQDVAVDSWRIEIAADHEQELVAASYIFGLRSGYFLGEVGVLAGAALIGWHGAYGLAAALGVIGLAAALLAQEPVRAAVAAPAARGLINTVQAAFLDPLRAFLATHGPRFVWMAALIAVFFLPDLVMTPMLAPLYIDFGFAREEIAGVRVAFGLTAMLAGVLCSGLVGAWLGSLTAIAIGALLLALSNLGFAALALSDGARPLWAAAVAGEGFASGFATVAMVAWAGRLTSVGHSATQFALLSSLMTLLGQVARGFSGSAVEELQRVSGDAFAGYASFFALTSLAGLPVLALVAVVAWRKPRPRAPDATAC